MKKHLGILCILLVCLLCAGCAIVESIPHFPGSDAVNKGEDAAAAVGKGEAAKPDPTQEPHPVETTPDATSEPTPEPTPEPTAPAWEGMTVNFLSCYDENYTNEWAEIIGLDASGAEVWKVTTETKPLAQINSYSPFAVWEDVYYYADGEGVVCLDLATGQERWRNTDFKGAGANGCVDGNGTLFACGYMGPDFFQMDKDGNTVKLIPTLHDDYYWAYRISVAEDNAVMVTLEGGPEGSWPDGYTLRVDLTDYSVTMVE